ncbi:MAG: O-antigen ligase family protein [Thermoanaerobaculum sp.]|nr:O-antigen ligase family protein [Thermoanaerobaculum sp.]
MTAQCLASGLLLAAVVFSPRLGIANPLLLAAFGVTLWDWWRNRTFRGWEWPLAAPVGVFCLASMTSALISADPLVSVQQLPRLLVFFLIPLAANLLSVRDFRPFAWGLAGMTCTLSVWGIWQYVHGYNTLEQRIRGPLSHYMTYAGWLLLAFCLLFALALLSRWRGRWLWLVSSALAVVAMFLSYTRNVWVGLVVGVLVLAACWRRRLLLLYPVLALLVVLAFPKAVRERLVSMVDLRQPANFDRLCMVYSGVQMVRDNPLTGVGLDMVPKLYPLYRRDDAPRYRVPHLHNNFLQIAAERGLVALAAYCWMLLAFFSATWRALGRVQGEERAVLAACLSAVAAITAAGFFEYNFWDAEIQYLTLTLMGGALGRKGKIG